MTRPYNGNRRSVNGARNGHASPGPKFVNGRGLRRVLNRMSLDQRLALEVEFHFGSAILRPSIEQAAAWVGVTVPQLSAALHDTLLTREVISAWRTNDDAKLAKLSTVTADVWDRLAHLEEA
jgi:hypothetical protein